MRGMSAVTPRFSSNFERLLVFLMGMFIGMFVIMFLWACAFSPFESRAPVARAKSAQMPMPPSLVGAN